MKNIMIVEDEEAIRTMVKFAFNRTDFKLTEAGDAREARQLINQNNPDLILMDWMLPDMNGVEFTKRLKREVTTRNIPVIMLTALSEEQNKITGLNAGADDYISKPFSPGELIARIQAVLRRVQPGTEDQQLSCEGLTIDVAGHRVMVGDETLNLGPTEFRLLKFFMQHPERVYNREQLLNQVWGQNVYVEERTVDVHILRLRKNLQPWGYDRFIQTVRSAGYRFTPDTQAREAATSASAATLKSSG